ncbi:hypothetical protein SO802_021602 [Lithocarpus litseifolius]|uniref:MULE transposase domain-containing protein n=1 Tax=Lithocarpus litseifolius TaxID=425828 RepID=A0AAW2CFC7_9ROSI
MPWFLSALKDASSRTMFKLNGDNRRVSRTCMFNCVFWAFGSCIEGFKHRRPIISIDAMHLYGKYKVKLLIAMKMDGNNKDYPLAFAVVESKSKEAWGWSLACLTLYVMDQDHLCIISNKHSGIKSCFDDISRTYLEPPKAYHWYCLRHLASNVNTKWKIPELKNLVWRANQVRKFKATLELIHNVKELVYEYLKLRAKKSGHLHMTTNADTNQ